MSTRSVTGTPPFGSSVISSPSPSFDDAEAAAAPTKESGGLPDGLDDRGGGEALGGTHAPGLDGLGEAAFDDRLPGGLAAGRAALAKVGARELVLDDSPALFARVTAGFSVVDGVADVDSAR